MEIDLLEIILRGLHLRNQQESSLICFHEELQSDELVRTITFEEVSTQSHKRQTAEPVEFGTPIAIFNSLCWRCAIPEKRTSETDRTEL